MLGIGIGLRPDAPRASKRSVIALGRTPDSGDPRAISAALLVVTIDAILAFAALRTRRCDVREFGHC